MRFPKSSTGADLFRTLFPLLGTIGICVAPLTRTPTTEVRILAAVAIGNCIIAVFWHNETWKWIRAYKSLEKHSFLFAREVASEVKNFIDARVKE